MVDFLGWQFFPQKFQAWFSQAHFADLTVYIAEFATIVQNQEFYVVQPATPLANRANKYNMKMINHSQLFIF